MTNNEKAKTILREYWQDRGAKESIDYMHFWCIRCTLPAEHERQKYKPQSGMWYYWDGLITELLTGSRGYLDERFGPAAWGKISDG